MQFPGQAKPVGVIFDTGISRIDDALALAMLYGLDGKNEIRLVAVTVSRPNLKAAAYCEAVGQFYAGSVNAAFGGSPRTLPVGMALSGKLPEDAPLFAAPLAREDGEGRPVYHPGIQKLNDTADPIAVIRNALTAQYDDNAIVLVSGPATNLARLLSQHDAKEWIVRKAKVLLVAAGSYPDGGPDLSIQTDVAAAQKLFSDWPTPIVACGAELGATILYPASSIERDFAWAPAHPIVDAYRAYRPMPYDAPTTAMAAALYAARSKEPYFRLSEPGTIRVAADGRTRFMPSASGKHRYLILDAEQKDRVLKTYIEIASAKPAPRTPRFPRPQQKAEQKQEVK